MQLINWSGPIIGPGSEWFWSMLQFIVVAGTLIGLYRQLRLQVSAAAIQQVNAMAIEWASERKTRYKIDALEALRSAHDPASVQNSAVGNLVDFWEDVGALVKAGHVHRRLVYQSFNNVCRWWWAVLAPSVGGARVETGDLSIGEHFEWLAHALAEMDEKAGVTVPPDAANPASAFDIRIQRARDEIRVAEELRAVIVRPMSSETAMSSPSAARRKRRPAAN